MPPRVWITGSRKPRRWRPRLRQGRGEQREGTGWLQGSPVIQERSKVRGSQWALAPGKGDVRRVQVSFSVCRWTHKVCGACREKTADRNAPGAVPSSDSRTLTWTSACKRARFDVKHAKNAKIVLEYREVHLQSVLQAISSRRSSNSIEEGVLVFTVHSPRALHQSPP